MVKVLETPADPVLAIYYISTNLLGTQYIFSKLEASKKFFSEKSKRSVASLLASYNALEYVLLIMEMDRSDGSILFNSITINFISH